MKSENSSGEPPTSLDKDPTDWNGSPSITSSASSATSTASSDHLDEAIKPRQVPELIQGACRVSLDVFHSFWNQAGHVGTRQAESFKDTLNLPSTSLMRAIRSEQAASVTLGEVWPLRAGRGSPAGCPGLQFS